MSTRRQFLSTLGAGATGACFAAAITQLTGARTALGGLARRGDARLDFGALEPLVAEIQETAPSRLLELHATRLARGERLVDLLAASALANTRTFGGRDYDGYHAFMAHVPSWKMAHRLPTVDAALPVLKVIYRNAARIREFGGAGAERLGAAAQPTSSQPSADRLLASVRDVDSAAAETEFATLSAGGLDAAYAALLPLVRDEMDVHRIVLAWRVREMLGALDTGAIVDAEHAMPLLRQMIHFCVEREPGIIKNGRTAVRTDVPALLAKHHLDGAAPGSRRLADAELEKLADIVFGAPRLEAAEAVAASLAGGAHPDDIGDALVIASNRLLLEDAGTKQDSDGKPRGSVHGASLGVHASDSANAWRNVARVTPQAGAAMLVAGAYHTAGQSQNIGSHPFSWRDQAAEFEGRQESADALLERLDGAVIAHDQPLACAAAERYLKDGHSAESLVARLLTHSIDADGALHAEKYFATATDEHARARAPFRDRHLIALARVCASQAVRRAPGIDQARKLLGYV
jgi:hypothetical protein